MNEQTNCHYKRTNFIISSDLKMRFKSKRIFLLDADFTVFGTFTFYFGSGIVSTIPIRIICFITFHNINNISLIYPNLHVFCCYLLRYKTRSINLSWWLRGNVSIACGDAVIVRKGF